MSVSSSAASTFTRIPPDRRRSTFGNFFGQNHEGRRASALSNIFHSNHSHTHRGSLSESRGRYVLPVYFPISKHSKSDIRYCVDYGQFMDQIQISRRPIGYRYGEIPPRFSWIHSQSVYQLLMHLKN